MSVKNQFDPSLLSAGIGLLAYSAVVSDGFIKKMLHSETFYLGGGLCAVSWFFSENQKALRAAKASLGV